MKQKKWLIAITAAGLLATSAGAGAGALVEKVTGILHGDVKVTVDGSETALKPVYIDGKAYLPARETADLLGYNLNWSSQELVLKDRDTDVEEEADLISISGVIVNVEEADGIYRLEVMGHGMNSWIILSVDEKTRLSSEQGALKPADLKAGMRVEAQYGPIVAKSYPGQSHAASIEVKQQASLIEDTITGVLKTDDGWKLQFSERVEGKFQTSLELNVGKETLLISRSGEQVDWSDLYPGVRVKAYYGPFLMKSMPPQSPAHVIIVEDAKLTREQADAYRDAAWSFVSDEQKPSVVSDHKIAEVEVAPASAAGILTDGEVAAKALEALVKEEGQMVIVTYYTNMDELIGPIKVVLHPETKQLLGYFIRK